MANVTVSMEQFVCDVEETHEAWDHYKFRFNNYLTINELDLANAGNAVTAKALLLHSAGKKVTERLR